MIKPISKRLCKLTPLLLLVSSTGRSLESPKTLIHPQKNAHAKGPQTTRNNSDSINAQVAIHNLNSVSTIALNHPHLTNNAYQIMGQINGRFPELAPSSRKGVNDKKLFRAYSGMGALKISSFGAASADIFINGKNISEDLLLTGKTNFLITIGKYTKDGFNTIRVKNIQPQGSYVEINIPYPILTRAKPETVGFSTTKLNDIDNLINSEISQGFPGAALLILKNGKIIKQTAYGYSKRYNRVGESIANPIKMKPDTLFDMASITKIYATNFALMNLVSTAKIDINLAVTHYLPEYKNQARESRLVKDLLTHSAGYAPEVKFFTTKNRYGDAFYSQNKDRTHYLLTTQVPFETARGVATVYSDTDYMLLGLIIERVTGKSLDSYLERTIYSPLGLTHTLFNPLAKGIDKNSIAATELAGNTRDGTIWFKHIRKQLIEGEVHDEKAFYSMAGVSGHAGLFSNLKECAVLAAVMLNRGGYGDVRLFEANVIDQFTKASDLDISYALGWRRAGNQSRTWNFGAYASPYAYGHSGWTGTFILIDPYYDVAIVLLTNRKHSPIIHSKKGIKFAGDSFETGQYGTIVTMIYEAFLENN